MDLYKANRESVGEEVVILGCNTVSHLAAGLVDIQRTGDDTSGMEWERKRKMGINTLAFRMTQHHTFDEVDADCVGITEKFTVRKISSAWNCFPTAEQLYLSRQIRKRRQRNRKQRSGKHFGLLLMELVSHNL